MGRKPNLGVYAVGPPIPRIALGSIGIPLSMPPGSPDIAGVALGLAAGNAEPTWLNAGAAEAQLCGTESVPREAACPAAAVTWALPIPGPPNPPVHEPKPLFSVNPNIRIWLAKTALLGPRDPPSEPAELIAEKPNVDIDAAELVPETRLIPEVSAVDDDVRVVTSVRGEADDEDDIEEAMEASSASASGAKPLTGADSAKLSGVDIAVVNGATVCAPVPAEVLIAWATASDCAVNPAGLVVGAGTVNGLSTDAACAAA